jgi:hypothetical protein
MFKFAGYLVLNTNQWFPSRVKAEEFARGHGINPENIVQAYTFAKQEYTAPAETAEYIEP